MPTPIRASASSGKLRASPDSAVIALQTASPMRDQLAAIPDVGEPAERNAEERVEDREGGAVEEAELGVGDAEVGADALGEDREDLAVEEVEDVDDDEHRRGRSGRSAGAPGAEPGGGMRVAALYSDFDGRQGGRDGGFWTRGRALVLSGRGAVDSRHRGAPVRRGLALGTARSSVLGPRTGRDQGGARRASPPRSSASHGWACAALCFRIARRLGDALAAAAMRWSALAGVALGIDFLLFNYGVRLTTAAVAGLLVNFGQVANVTSRECCWARR